jgi:hypothetical protein
VFNGVRDLQDTSLLLSLISNEAVFLLNAYEDSGVLGSSNDGGEDGSGSIFAGEAGLHDTGSIVNNTCRDFVTHSLLI